MARQLHNEGTALVLVARRRDLLDAMAAGFGDNTEVIEADLTSPQDTEIVATRLAAEPPIDLLINNAGAGRSSAFADDDLDNQLAQIDLNVTALVRLTHAAVGAMRPRREGAVLNVSSVAWYSPVPHSAIYGATKAFVSSFSQAIHEEERPHGITITTLAPGFTRTNFQKEADFDSSEIPAFLWQSAEVVAAVGLDAAAKGKGMVIPGAHNKALVGTIKGLPTSVQRRLAALF